jgi:hypothetical protein
LDASADQARVAGALWAGLAQARIELDLDDGVKVNYLKLGEALASIPGLAANEGD